MILTSELLAALVPVPAGTPRRVCRQDCDLVDYCRAGGKAVLND